MRKTLLTALAALGLAAGAGAGTAGEYRLTILHTNDFHSRIEPVSKYNSGCDAEANAAGKCYGGSARLATAIREARRLAGNAILLDAGDQFQGSLFYTHYKGRAAAEMMNRLGYDAMTVGNHEFDDGPEVLRGFMDAVEFPVLMSNADVSGEKALAGRIRPSAVIERGGERIGLIGLTPQDTGELSSPGPGVRFTDPVAAVQAEVDRLTAQGIDKIVVLSHSGYEVDKRIAAATTGVDVIVGGHSHTLLSNVSDRAAGPYPTMVNGVAIVQAYAYGRFLGELNVTFDEAGRVIAAEGEPLVMDASVSEDAEIAARVSALAEPLEEVRRKVVASAAAPIEGSRDICRVRECEMGNLVADAMLDRVAGQGVQIAIMNAGGLRASIDAGPVTMGEILTVLPFRNTLATFEIDGQGIIDALENGVSQVEEVKGRFPQVAGLGFTWDPARPPGSRIVEVLVESEDGYIPIDPQATYLVVTNNYVRNGGDGYRMFAGDDRNAYDFGPDLAEVVAEYLAANQPYQPFTEDRIVRRQ